MSTNFELFLILGTVDALALAGAGAIAFAIAIGTSRAIVTGAVVGFVLGYVSTGFAWALHLGLFDPRLVP